MNVTAGTIQVWSDLLCPFAHVAIHRLRTTRAELGMDAAVRLDHHTFALELFNGPHSRPGTDSEAVGLGQLAPEIGFRLWTQPDWTYPSIASRWATTPSAAWNTMVASIASLGNSRWAIWSAASLSVPVSRPPLASFEPTAPASRVTPMTTAIQANRTAPRRRWQKVAIRSIMPPSVKEQARSAHPAALRTSGGVIPRYPWLTASTLLPSGSRTNPP